MLEPLLKHCSDPGHGYCAVVRTTRATLTGGTLVAAGMMTMNITVYAFNVLAARLLVPQEFGALTALFGIMLVGTVASLGLQAVTARRLAIDPDDARRDHRRDGPGHRASSRPPSACSSPPPRSS